MQTKSKIILYCTFPRVQLQQFKVGELPVFICMWGHIKTRCLSRGTMLKARLSNVAIWFGLFSARRYKP